MYSDPQLAMPLEAGDALSPLPPQPPPKEMTMQACFKRPKRLPARAAAFAAALAASATLLLAVGGAFHSLSSDPVLVDSPQARFAVVGCDKLGDRVARKHCVHRLVAEAKARDAGAVQLATLAARQRGARQ